MLEKPDVEAERIAACLKTAFGLDAPHITFLPLGADEATAVYRVTMANGVSYFLKLRRRFDEISVAMPQLLSAYGLPEIIAPISTQASSLWAQLDDYAVILYPFIEGQNGFETGLTDVQQIAFGKALRRVHTTMVPDELRNRLPQERYSSQFRQSVKRFLDLAQRNTFADPTAQKLAQLLNYKREIITQVIMQAEQWAAVLQNKSLEHVLCHADCHPGNLLLTAQGALYIVDWDEPVFAPKERDLMFIGAWPDGVWDTSRDEALFYEGYGNVPVDRTALAYYRCERFVQDVAAYCPTLLLTDKGGDDREAMYQQLARQFLPGEVVDRALKASVLAGQSLL